MFSLRQIRKKSRWRSLLVCALLPILVLNGRTLIGCGCDGHFESICHQKCSVARCCGKHEGVSCACSGNHHKNVTDGPSFPSSKSASLRFNDRCKVIVRHEVMPATISDSHLFDEVTLPFFTIDSVDRPSTLDLRAAGRFIAEHSVAAVFDRVVTLRRLLI